MIPVLNDMADMNQKSWWKEMIFLSYLILYRTTWPLWRPMPTTSIAGD